MARIINSPGLQVTEKDLSLRLETPVGTNVVVPGFAPQGPTSEAIQITTSSELESIFGIPTTPAERYFYYSCKEVLNSPARLHALRLPYGAEGGSDFSKSYSGLFYPTTFGLAPSLYTQELSTLLKGYILSAILVNSNAITLVNNTSSLSSLYTPSLSTTSLVDAIATNIYNRGTFLPFMSATTDTYTLNPGQSAWYVHEPISKVLDQAVYEAIKRGDFQWDYPDQNFSTTYNYDEENKDLNIGAGFFFINDLQSTINEVGEGYYVGFADNSSVNQELSPNFDSIKKMVALSASEAYSIFDPARLDFQLSATSLEADTGADSISENLERVGFTNYRLQEYADHLCIGIYKIRRSNTDATKLTLATNERYLGSVNANRKVIAPTGGTLENSYIEDVINAKSSTTKMYVNPGIAKDFKWTSNSFAPEHKILVAESAKALFPLGVYTPDARDQNNTKQIGEVPYKLEKALRSIDNPEYSTVDVIVDAGLSTVYSTAVYQGANSTTLSGGRISFNDEYGIKALSAIKEDWHWVANTLINFAENTRKDCMAIIDPPRSIFVVGRDTKTLSQEGKNFTSDMYNPLRDCLGPLESNYAATYANWVKIGDLYTGRKFWCPISGYVGAIFAKNDAVANTWAAPAGLNRGRFQNALDVAFNPNQKMRDRLYELGANPVLYFNGEGYAVYGQKTLQTKPTAFDRINVRRLFLTLERAVVKTVQYFVFEPNTSFTRHRVVSTITPIFDVAKNTEGLYDFLIVCDERNNTPETIDNNELIVDIYLKPVRTAEFVLLNFIATRTGQSFQELI